MVILLGIHAPMDVGIFSLTDVLAEAFNTEVLSTFRATACVDYRDENIFLNTLFNQDQVLSRN